MTALAVTLSQAATVEPIRLDLRDPAEITTTCRLAIRHAAAGQRVNCFVESDGTRVLAFRMVREAIGTRIVSSAAGCSGVFTRPDRIEDAVEHAARHAFENLAEEQRRPTKTPR